ncbi:MAG: phosphatidate cytidylyltransferase [Gammaproteobacteria bacterium]|nr:phosphatidate cytidylyltransferase [Gammaproteobacteria bacterium]MDH3536149.1 phosphatidate cytidylyltransferase [Gammaproteobacteria bacterium]
MLRQRVITGIILGIVFIGSVLLLETRWVGALFTVVLFLATRELLALTVKPSPIIAAMAAAGFALLFWWSLSLVNPLLIFSQSLAGLVLWLVIAMGLLFYRHHGNWSIFVRLLMLALGLDLLWICVHGLVYLHYVYGGELLLFMFTLVWVADIGAYFCGRRFGRHKLAPSISPGKTWEGVIGGVGANLVWIPLVFWFQQGWGFGLVEFMLIGMSTVSFSIIGDLFESVLKREAGVKDSGKLLPGHGGVLDRIDSVIAAAPVFVAGLLMAGSS